MIFRSGIIKFRLFMFVLNMLFNVSAVKFQYLRIYSNPKFAIIEKATIDFIFFFSYSFDNNIPDKYVVSVVNSRYASVFIPPNK